MRRFKELEIVRRMLMESISSAVFSMRSDKVRTGLSLLGVTVGIFSVTAVSAVTGSMERSVMEGLKSFGPETVSVSVLPFGPEGQDWERYMKRPPLSRRNFLSVERNIELPGNLVYLMTGSGGLSAGRRSFQGAAVMMVSGDCREVLRLRFRCGRNFSPSEMERTSEAVILGDEVAESLFGETDPVGRRLKVRGADAVVIGVLERQGENMSSFFDADHAVLVPLEFGRSRLDLRSSGGMILAMPEPGTDRSAFVEELRRVMRNARGLSPAEEDDFSINEMTQLISLFGEVFGMIGRAGRIIGGFSLLIGIFGIAEVMFISVQERMPQIGVRKALGARRYVILTEFLAESCFLSLGGGLAGIAAVFLFSFPLSALIVDFTVRLSPEQVLAGLLTAIAAGMISGLIPAWKAAAVSPVKAIRG